MPLFGPPDIEKMKAKDDVKGLIKALSYSGYYSGIPAQAATALGELREPSAALPLIDLIHCGPDYSNAAIKALVKIGAPSVDAVILLLKDWNVRAKAADMLGQIGDPRAAGPLVQAIKDELGCARPYQDHSLEMDAIIAALVKIGNPAVEPLIAALGEKDAAKYAVQALGQLKDARAVEPLVAAIYNEASAAYAVDALIQLGDSAAFKPLATALKCERAEVRAWAAKALEELRWQPESTEEKAVFLIASGEWDTAARMGADAVDPLMAYLQDPDQFIRNGVIKALKKIGSTAVDPLIAEFNKEAGMIASQNGQEDTDHWVRLFTITEILGGSNDPRVVEPLISFLNNPQMSQAADEVLVRFRDTRAAKSLVNLLTSKHQELKTLAENNGLIEVIMKQLSWLLQNSISPIYEEAIDTLLKLGSDDSRKMVFTKLENADSDTQREIFAIIEKYAHDEKVLRDVCNFMIFSCNNTSDLYADLTQFVDSTGMSAVPYFIEFFNSLEVQKEGNRLSLAYTYIGKIESILSRLTGKAYTTSKEWQNWYDFEIKKK